MLGDIHLAVKYQMITGHGSSVWKVILERTRMDPYNDFLPYHYYDDNYTKSLMDVCAQIIGIPIERYLEQFGDCMVGYIQKGHYCAYMASCFEKFLQSLETVCELMRLGKRGKAVTEFSLEKRKDRKKMMLHFVTSIPWMIYVIYGFVKTMAIQQFKTYCEMKEEKATLIGKRSGLPCTHFVISLYCNLAPVQWVEEMPAFRKTRKAIPMRLVPRMCPYFFVIGKNLEMKYCGISITKLCGVVPLTPFDNYFNIQQPIMPNVDFDEIVKFSKSWFTVEAKGKRCNLFLKGTMIPLRDGAHIMFIGSIVLNGPEALRQNLLDVEDIPSFTASSHLMMLREKIFECNIDRSHLLVDKQAALRKIEQEVKAKRASQGCQLCKTLPQSVADALNEGETISPQRHESVSLLHIEIANFEEMSNHCSVVDLGKGIEKLYEIIKEETAEAGAFLLYQNADHFVVISGAPDENLTHSEEVSNAALEIMLRAVRIKIPGVKKFELKMGLHTGTVVSTLLDDKTPQYTLCGDTVIIAKEIADASIPNKIHLGPDTFRIVERALGFSFDRRGIVDLESVNGIITFFLTGNPRRGEIPFLKWDPSEEDLMHQLQAESAIITSNAGFSCVLI